MMRPYRISRVNGKVPLSHTLFQLMKGPQNLTCIQVHKFVVTALCVSQAVLGSLFVSTPSIFILFLNSSHKLFLYGVNTSNIQIARLQYLCRTQRISFFFKVGILDIKMEFLMVKVRYEISSRQRNAPIRSSSVPSTYRYREIHLVTRFLTLRVTNLRSVFIDSCWKTLGNHTSTCYHKRVKLLKDTHDGEKSGRPSLILEKFVQQIEEKVHNDRRVILDTL